MLLKGVLIFVHIVVSIFLILVVLLQTGKRADLAGAFGGGGSQTAFGARGAATVLSKLTTTFAIVFMITSLSLALISSGGTEATGSALEDLPETTSESAPAPELPDESTAAEPDGEAPTGTADDPAPEPGR